MAAILWWGSQSCKGNIAPLYCKCPGDATHPAPQAWGPWQGDWGPEGVTAGQGICLSMASRPEKLTGWRLKNHLVTLLFFSLPSRVWPAQWCPPSTLFHWRPAYICWDSPSCLCVRETPELSACEEKGFPSLGSELHHPNRQIHILHGASAWSRLWELQKDQRTSPGTFKGLLEWQWQ